MRISKTKVVAAATAAGVIVGAAASSRAADMPVKAPAAVVSTNWTGFYVNGGGGYGMWTADSNTVSTATSVDAPLPLVKTQGGRGWLGRVGGGFDYQFSPKIVAGLFANFDFSSLKGTIQDEAPGISADIRQTRSWAAGGRVGWLITPDLLSYINAGYTNARFSSGTMVDNGTGNFGGAGVPSGFVTPAFSRSGWFLGGGAETALGGGLFWRTEYRYAYYGNQAITDTNPATGVNFTNINFKPQVQTITTELVYKFGAPGAPVYRAPATAAAVNWNGAYVTGGAGYGVWAADETTSAVPGAANAPIPVVQREGGKGWLGRIGGGYDYRIGHRIIAGILADFDFSSLKGTIEDSGAGLAGTTRQDWAWAAGARAGWLVTPSILSYVNAGYTMAHFTGTTMFFVATAAPFGGFTTPSFTADGWFLGGGVEAQLSGAWFWRNEYRYAAYGSESVSDTSPLAGALIRNNINFKPAVQTITTQLVYKFATQ